MSLRERGRPGLGTIEPCLPSPAKAPPSGLGSTKSSTTAFAFSRDTMLRASVRSCLIDGEAIVCDEKGLAVFELIRRNGNGDGAVLCAVDLLELDGKDLRWKPIETRKALLADLLNEEDGASVYRAACQLGCEGIVSKRLGSTYRRGRSPLWVKVKNPKAPAVKREAEEDWGDNGALKARNQEQH